MGPGLFPGAPSTVDAEPLTELSVALTPLAVAQIAGLALVLATLAGLVTLSRITKYEPIKILQERN
jgi:putative ABC transport system permease protein